MKSLSATFPASNEEPNIRAVVENASRRPELVSVIVPVFNEADNLKELLPALFRSLEGLGLSHEVIVVDDGSIDQTGEIVRQLARAAAPRPVVP